MNYITFNNRQVPMLGLGTYKIQGFDTCFNILDNALKLGYRLFDTAQVYKNESDIGQSFEILLPKHNLKRDDIFIITKIAPINHGEKCLESVKESLMNLKVSYIDLVLIHWPGTKGIKLNSPKQLANRKKTWATLESFVHSGIVKSIGVSNYNERQLKELFEYSNQKPQWLQSEYHPLLKQDDLVKFCKAHSIVFQAYSSLGTSNENLSSRLIDSEVVNKIGGFHGKKAAQVLLKWALQKGICVIPKASSHIHLMENIDIFDFELKENDIIAIDKLNLNEHLCWNPDTVL